MILFLGGLGQPRREHGQDSHAGSTHIIAFNVRYRQFLRQVLGDGALAATCGSRYDPHVPMMRGRQSAVDLLDRGHCCVVPGRR